MEELDVSAEAARAALRRILESPCFDASERNRRFLTHIVEETLVGDDLNGALEALEMERTLNPNDATILADLGRRHAMPARWDEAAPLLGEAYACNRLPPDGCAEALASGAAHSGGD